MNSTFRGVAIVAALAAVSAATWSCKRGGKRGRDGGGGNRDGGGGNRDGGSGRPDGGDGGGGGNRDGGSGRPDDGGGGGGGDDLRGFVDLHAHPMGHLGFGGALVHGAPDINMLLPAHTVWNADGTCNQSPIRARTMEQALATCFATHGGWDASTNRCGHLIRHEVLKNVEDHHYSQHGPSIGGASAGFANWPRHDDITHQKMWIDWVRRAHAGGLRVMVALAVNNETLARSMKGNPPWDDATTGQTQIDELRRMVGRHAAWMQVADSPTALRRIVRAGKLAVIIGLELDDFGSFTPAYRADPSHPTDAEIRTAIRDWYDQGVRYIFPVHVTDNVLGGTAVYADAFAAANANQWGAWWALECAVGADAAIGYHYERVDIGAAAAFLFGDTPPQPIDPVCSNGHKNSRGLTRRGKVALREMMRLGMMIDIDHQSRRTVEAVLDLAEQLDYPVMSGHNGFGRDDGDMFISENNRTAAQYRRIARLGGMIGVGLGEATTAEFQSDLRRVIAAVPADAGIAIGTDINGVFGSPRPPCVTLAPNGCDVPACQRPPFAGAGPATTGGKTWDYRVDGVAHYGLVPDFLCDVRRRPGAATQIDRLLGGVEALARSWERARTRSTEIGATTSGKQAVGEYCERHSDCTSGRCDTGATTTNHMRCTCSQPTCGDGVYCTHDHQCRSGSCSASGGLEGTCNPRVALGQSCAGGKTCRTALVCGSGNSICVCKSGGCADGDYCDHNSQCKSNLCNLASHTCVQRPGLGGSCAGGLQCKTGLVCGSGNATCVCQPGKCGFHQYCDQSSQCSSTYYCDLAGHRCVPRQDLGDSCQGGKLCKSSLVCGSGNATCVCKPGACSDGAYCDHNSQCKSNLCDVAGHTCADRPGLGESCAGGLQCESGLACGGGNAICVCNPGTCGFHKYCDQSSQCSSAYYCDLASHQCVTRRDLGQSCQGGKLCKTSLVCGSGNAICVCKPGACSDGAYCDSNSQCKSNLCDVAGHACVDRPGLGQSCAGGLQCRSGLVCGSGNAICVCKPGTCGFHSYCDNNSQCRSGFCDLVDQRCE